jgi:hypothetical protein
MNKNWPLAIEAGEVARLRDSLARGDSTFYLRLGTAYHTAKMPYKALGDARARRGAFPRTRGCTRFYTQYIRQNPTR